MRRTQLLTVLAVSLLLPACVGGPAMVERSRGRYNEALRRTGDEQLLLNLVRLRYRDNPQFLELQSIATQFSFAAGFAADANFNEDVTYADGSAGARFGYVEEPTVSYTPLAGQDFAQRMLSPLDLETLTLVASSAWSVERVLRVCVQSLNGVGNARTAAGPTPSQAPAYADFVEAAKLLRTLQKRGELAFGYEAASSDVTPPLSEGSFDVVAALQAGYGIEARGARMSLTKGVQQLKMLVPDVADASDEMRRLRTLLRLSPTSPKYTLYEGRDAVRRADLDSIQLETRSSLGALYFLSHGIDIPEAHVEAGHVTRTVARTGEPFDWGPVLGGIFHVRSSYLRPSDAAVAVPYRGYWYYLPDDDLTTKTTFSMVAQLVALQSGEVEGSAPVLTLSVD